MKKALKITLNIIIVILFVTAAVAVGSVLVEIISGREPTVFGFRLYIVETDSMTPEIKPQDMILSKTFKNGEAVKTSVKKGDIVTFVAECGELKGLTITHKVIEEPYFDEARNRYVILTQGTKSGAPVDPPVPVENVRARLVKNMPAIGKIFGFFRSSAAIWLLLVSVLSLVAFLVTGIVKGVIANKKGEEEPAPVLSEEEKERERLRQEAIKELLAEQKTENTAINGENEEKNGE